MHLEQRQRNSQQLRPQMLTAAKILQMDSVSLNDYLFELQLENPMLEYRPSTERVEPMKSEKEALKAPADAAEYGAPGGDETPYTRVPDKNHSFYGEDMVTHLVFQLDRQTLDASVRYWAIYLILHLEPSGYLRTPLEALASEESQPLLCQALTVVQSLLPAGVGARDLSECLCLQLSAQGETGLAYTIAAEHLPEVSRRAYAAIALRYGVPEADVRAACETIRTLSPAPCAQFSRQDNAVYLLPDLLVRQDGGALRAEINRQRQPMMTLSPFYRRLAKETADQSVKEYLQKKYAQANWTIQCVAQREKTILRCADEVLRRQQAFFIHGEALQPMTMTDVANTLDIHVSTVSRALRGKTIQTPNGVRDLSDLFSNTLDRSGGLSADHAQRALVKLIAKENTADPLSDAVLSQRLTAKGIPVSRRTVAKYRQALHIPAAVYRRR